MKFTRITVNPRQMGGIPCLRGLRIPVATVIGMVADGMTEEESWALTRTWCRKTSAKPSGTPPRPFESANSRF